MPHTVQLAARGIKITVVLNSAGVAEALAPFAEATGRVPVVLAVEGRKLRFDMASKAIRKALATLAEHSPDRVAVIVQGRLMTDDVVAEAGLVAQAKAPRAA